LFKNNNLKLKTVALFRNPVDRIVSQFAYEYYFHNWATGDSLQPTFENFLDYIYGDGTIPNYVTNLQAKTLCSTVNSVESKRFNFQFLSNNLDANTIFRKIASTGFLIDQHPLNKSLDFIEELDLVGTVDNRNKFLDKLATMLKQDGYGGNMLNSVWNRTKMDTSFIHNNMSPEDLNQIIKNNIYDFKIYEHLLTKGL
jgi:hypothetical protein